MSNRSLYGLLVLLFALPAPLQGALADMASELEGGPVQVMLGVSFYDEDELTFENGEGESAKASVDLSRIPFGGVARQIPLVGKGLDLGFEGGFLVSWRPEVTDFYAGSSGGSGTVALGIESQLLLVDFSAGLFVSARLGRHVRLYAGGGPVLLYGMVQTETEREDADTGIKESEKETLHALGLGLYARTGVEFRVKEQQALGLALRYMSTPMDFGGSVGERTVQGPQVMLTYTFGF